MEPLDVDLLDDAPQMETKVLVVSLGVTNREGAHSAR